MGILNHVIPKINRKRGILVLLLFVFSIPFIWLLINNHPVEKIEKKPFFENDRPFVISHRGGADIAPENTLYAFERSRQLGVDAIEFDVHITKDQELVVIHDSTVDRTTDGTGKVEELTLHDIQLLDAAYHYRDLEDGQYRYRGQGITIPTVEEVFKEFSDMRMVIEIKDTNNEVSIPEISRQLWELIQKYNMEDQVVISSFSHQIINTFNEYSEGAVAITGGRSEVVKFFGAHKLFLNGLYSPSVDGFHLPTRQSILHFADAKLIERANELGLEIHYWTINDEETMRYVLDMGAHGIMTDRPDILIKVVEEY